MSIVERVPAEIWQTVFETVVASTHSHSLAWEVDSDYEGPRRHPRILGAPSLTLSHVSPLWRAIMIDLPSLWSSISVEFSRVARSFLRLLNLYLTNSGQHPLVLRITRELSRRPLSKEDATAWKALSPHLNRCRELYLRVPGFFDFPPVHNLSFPDLLSLYEEEHGMDYPVWFWNAVEAAPRLTRAHINYFRYPDPHPLPYRQLTFLGVFFCDKEEAQALLEALPTCRRLLTLKLENLDADAGEIFNAPPRTVGVPTLRMLSIHNQSFQPSQRANSVFSAFCQLSLPALTDLELTCHYWPAALHTLLERSSTSVVKLKLDLGPEGPVDHHHPFSAIPLFSCLTHLELTLCPFELTTTVLAEILLELQPARDLDGRLMLPQLTHLLLQASPGILTPSVGESLVQLVRSRRLASHPLKNTSIIVTTPPGSSHAHDEPAIVKQVRAADDVNINVTSEVLNCGYCNRFADLPE
ncbi:hypothetical protein PM082_022262 [Marasmius tenuissimus]|nr:hypothetical protein PM082_022262 [Marasmius tenuissimus]